MTDPRSFYTERIPAQFNAAFEAQHQLASSASAPEGANQLFEAMLAVDTTICVEVEDAQGSPFYLNVESGRMIAGSRAEHPLLLTLIQDENAFEVLAGSSGDSALAFLGGLAGLVGEFQLTGQRIAALASVEGSYAFQVEGDAGFRVVAHFGEAQPSEPLATIRVDAKAYARLQSGELNPMEAFMNGAINIDGDMQKAMSLALALLGGD